MHTEACTGTRELVHREACTGAHVGVYRWDDATKCNLAEVNVSVCVLAGVAISATDGKKEIG